MRHVTLVCGPPCAGKTTHVNQHAQPGDLVLDQDRIGPAEMRRALAHVATMTDGTAWVIRSCPGPARRALLAAAINADDLVLLVPTRAELMARAQQRPHPAKTRAAILAWLAAEAGAGTPARPARPASTQQPARKTTTQRGLGWAHQQARQAALRDLREGTPCPRCGLPMYRSQRLDLDDWPGRAFGGPQTKRLAHAKCNRSAGGKLGNALRAARSKHQRSHHSRRW